MHFLSSARVRRVAAVLAATTILLAACGDDDDSPVASSDDSTSTSAPMADMDDHDHDGLEIPADGAPTLTLDAVLDPKSGVNIRLETTDFRFAPEHASTDHVDGEGHAHVYVDGEKLGRVYTEWFHLGGLEPGDHEISVDLNANDHRPFLVDGTKIEAAATVTVPEPADGHSHGDAETFDVPADAVAPRISIEAFEDPKSGFNVRLTTTDYTFAPEAASTEAVFGEGHAHIYVDGNKLDRVYGDWYHVDGLTDGEHEIRVELSANDHRPYAVDGVIIDDTATVVVPEGEGVAADDHGHGDDHDHADDHGDGDHEAADTGLDNGDADQVIAAVYTGGALDIDSRQEAELGSTVTIEITADVADDVHIHGYDLYLPVAPGETASITFVADIPGVFEVELEGGHILLFDLAVS